MHITFAPRGYLQIDDAMLIYKNFAGEQTQFNRAGDRNFSVKIDDVEVYEALIKEGWNVKAKPPREEGDIPFMHLPVKVKFNERGPKVYLLTGNTKNELDEETIACLDHIDILTVDLDIRPYDWEVNGKTGRSAYLDSIHVVQKIDRFAARYED